MAWLTNRCAKNHDHRVFQQAKTDECAIACAAMVIERVNGTEVADLAELRQESQDHTGGYRPSVKDAGGLHGEKVAQRAHMAAIMTASLKGTTRHVGDEHIGTLTSSNLPALLQANGVATAHAATAATGTALRNAFKAARANRPIVIRVKWDAGGAFTATTEVSSLPYPPSGHVRFAYVAT